MENNECDLLVDTGSSVTIVSKEIYDQINCPLYSVTSTLVTADGEPLKVFGMAELPLMVGGKSFINPVVVAELGGMSGILGLDFLSQYEFIIDTSKGRMSSPKVKIQLFKHRESNTRCARVHLTETIHIPAKSEIYVHGEIRGHYSGQQDGCLEPLHKFRGSEHLILPKVVTNTNNPKVVFSIMNPTPNPKILKKNVQVATLHPVEQIVTSESEIPKTEKSETEIDKGDSYGLNTRISAVQSKTELPPHLTPLLENTSEHLTDDQRAKLAKVILDYADIFVGPDGKLGQTNIIEHTINTGDAKPIKIPPRRLPVHMREVAEQEIQKMLDQDIIESSCSPWAAPIVLVKKKDGSTRFCVDYRRLNSVTKKDAYPLPLIGEALDSLGGSNFFCVMDLASGFWQLKVSEEDKPKTAFATHRGLFQFKRMPFGLANSPASFERLMEITLNGLQFERCLVYLDDVIVFGSTFEQTLQNLTTVFDRFKTANLKLKPKKCAMFKEEVSYLGHVVSKHGIKCDPAKLDTIKTWPTPESVADVRSFLGLASYYRKYIENFSTISFPLTQLTKKNQRFYWSEDCEQAFSKLKSLLISAPILAYPLRHESFILDTDASAYGIGAVLSQVQDGKEKVIAYASKTLSKSQMRYCTTYRELLAVVAFVKHFKHYLYGKRFLLRTDHSSLTWLKNFKEPEGMVARWISTLETFDFGIKHRKGSLHGNADGLSRRPRRGCKRDDCQQCEQHKPPQNRISAVTRSTSNNQSSPVAGPFLSDPVGQRNQSNWIEQWTDEILKQYQQQDPVIKSAIDRLKASDGRKPSVQSPNPDLGTIMRQWQLLVIKDEILYRKYLNEDGTSYLQLVAPQAIREEILRHLHDCKTSGHFGRDKTLSRVRSRFYWPGMTNDVKRWCQTCTLCQRRKPGPGVGKSPMDHVTVSGPLDCIAIDIMGPLPVTEHGNQYIMVVSDYFSKWTEAYALPNHQAQTVADKLVSEFICRFGTPNRIHTDRGSEFESHLFAHMCELLQITKSRTTPYHPQSDGMVERFNRTLQQVLAMFVSENKDDWDDHLPYVTMAYRSSVQESTKCTPNLVMLGREISLPLDIMAGTHQYPSAPDCQILYIEWLKSAMQRAFDTTYENLHLSFNKQKKYHDVKLKHRLFEIGDKVLRWYPPLANQKLGLGWVGPYSITRKLSDITYEIQNCQNLKTVVVHVDHLKILHVRHNNHESSDTPDEILESPNLHYLHQNDDPKNCPNVNVQTTPIYTRRGRLIKPPVKFSP